MSSERWVVSGEWWVVSGEWEVVESENANIHNMSHVNSFKELIVYQKAYKLAMEIFEISRDFPKEEKYSLTDQIRRSSRSVTSNIAESWAKKRYLKLFVSKLIDSLGEEYETES